jgi:hypothetical protein
MEHHRYARDSLYQIHRWDEKSTTPIPTFTAEELNFRHALLASQTDQQYRRGNDGRGQNE